MSLSNKGAGVDPRLQSVTNALFLNASDDVVMRSHVEGLTLQTGDILVDAVKIWDGTHYVQLELPNNDNEAGGWSLSAETYNMVFNDATSSWDRLRGDATHGAWVNIKNSSIKVDQGSAGLTPWKVDIGSNGTVTANVTFPDYYKVSKNGSANATDNPIYTQFTNTTIGLSSGSATIGKVAQDKTTPWTVGLDAGTQTIGNVKLVDSNGAQNDSTHPVYVNFVTGAELEIKNDTGNPLSISRNTSANSTSNRLYVSMETDAVVADSNYFFNVARGLVDSQYLEFKNGYCGSMSSSSTGYTIWNEGTAYPWSSWTTAQTLYIASSSASDNNTKRVWINGLDASFNKISEYVTLNGTSAVTTVNQYLRVNNTILVQGDTNVGTIHTYIGGAAGTVVGSMAPELGRNKQAVFTVPEGYTAYILYGDVSSYKNGSGNVSGQVDMRVRTNVTGTTTPFINAFAGIAANGQFRSDFPVPFQVPAKTDIDVRFAASGNATTVTCSWEMILIPN